MTNPNQTADAREAEDMGEKPDTGRTPDALTEALSGSDMGSDTRAGSLQGGAATGSEIDPDQDTVNEALAVEGRASSASAASARADPEPIKNTGEDATGQEGEAADSGGGEADAATG
ncbi:MAG: ribonuclease [Brevundimonas sp.]|nr:ribonuclease [Brevundimonas sp.]